MIAHVIMSQALSYARPNTFPKVPTLEQQDGEVIRCRHCRNY